MEQKDYPMAFVYYEKALADPHLPSYAESRACVLKHTSARKQGSLDCDAVGHSLWRRTMNARRVPFEAPKERSRVCFGGFRPTKHVEEPWALAHGAPPDTERIRKDISSVEKSQNKGKEKRVEGEDEIPSLGEDQYFNRHSSSVAWDLLEK